MSTIDRTTEFEQQATEQEKAEVAAVEQQVAEVIEVARAIEVRNAEEQEHAIEFLSRAAAETKNTEAARTKLVKPLNDHVKMINATFKPKTAALEEAIGVVKGKVLAYRSEQERLRAEAQARLDVQQAALERAAEEERRRKEDEARAAREQAARAAAAAEAEARLAASRRREQLEREATALERRASRMTTDALQAACEAVAAGDEDPAVLALGEASLRELERRRAAREAQEAVAAARQAEEDARAAEEAARNAPRLDVPAAVVAAPPSTMRAASGSASASRPWTATVEDESKVPRRFLVVDQKLINAAVRAGERDIPGVRVEQVDRLAVRARA